MSLTRQWFWQRAGTAPRSSAPIAGISGSSTRRFPWWIVELTYTVPAPGPVDGPTVGDDRPLLAGYLAWQRSTLLNICAGLTGQQLASRPLPSSRLTLLGLLRHAAKIERIWLRDRAAGEDVQPLYGGAGDPTISGISRPPKRPRW